MPQDTESMVERVAQAILTVDYPDAHWDYCKSVPDHPLYRRSMASARAALQVTPTEAMIRAGNEEIPDNVGYSNDALAVYVAMMKEALK